MTRPNAASLLLSFACLASTALAVKTQFFAHTTREDFSAGTLDTAIVTSQGQLKLARQATPLLPDDRQFDAIVALAHHGEAGTVFATFPESQVLRLKDEKLESLGEYPDRTITAIAIEPSGSVLVALAGPQAEVVRIGRDGEPAQTLFKQEGVSYVWSILPTGDTLLLATGPEARIFSIKDGTTAEVADLAGQNILSLIAAGDGTAYAGTDELGLVYRLDPGTRKPFLLYDAAESEITALAIDAQGHLLVAASETRQRPEAAAGPQKPSGGKPEKASGPATIESAPPQAPRAPDQPPEDPIPGDPPDAPTPLEGNPTTAPARPAGSSGPRQPNGGSAEAGGGGGGSAVYRIDARTGFVTELFRGPGLIYSMAAAGPAVLIGTGEDGEILEIRPDAEEAAVVARTTSEQVTGIIAGPDDALICATSNSGGIVRLSGGFASSGTYTSPVLDATVPSTFGTLKLRGSLPEKTGLTLQTRTGNIDDPEAGGWSDWSDAAPAREFTAVTAPTARYAQYRLTLSTSDPARTPSVDEVSLAYQKPNLSPRIGSITVASAEDPQNPGNFTITWEASDPNEDELRYSLYTRQVGRGGWVMLAEHITENTYIWPARQTGDGQYEVKVVATDARANPADQGKEVARVSDGVLIDNTPPVIGDVEVDGTTVRLRVVDRSGTVATVEYAVNRANHWQKALPDDTMADSPEERYTLALRGLARGQNTLTVRATDENGNTGYETLSVNVP